MEDDFARGGGWSGVGGGGGDDSGGKARDRERCGAADEASLTSPPLTSCCAARFLPGRGPGVGDPCLTALPYLILIMTLWARYYYFSHF